MKLTKPLIIAALVAGSLFAGSTVLQAQTTNTNTPAAGAQRGLRGGRGGPSLDQLAQQLNLDDATKAKVKPILDARDQKVKDLIADTTLAPADRRAKMQAIQQETSDALQKVLTADQFTKYQQLMQRGPRNRGGGTPPAGAPPATPPQN
jgi:Spy/CpxP family protein refolding chaperone